MASNNPNHKANLRVPTHEQAVANGHKGGTNSGISKRKKKAMKEVLNALLDLPMREGSEVEELTSFKDFNLKNKNVTVEQAILIAQIIKAANGDTRAATFIRDTAGEKILKDASDTNAEFEDDGFTAAIKASAKGVWD